MINADVHCIQHMLTQFIWVAGVTADPEAQAIIDTILRPEGAVVLPTNWEKG